MRQRSRSALTYMARSTRGVRPDEHVRFAHPLAADARGAQCSVQREIGPMNAGPWPSFESSFSYRSIPFDCRISSRSQPGSGPRCAVLASPGSRWPERSIYASLPEHKELVIEMLPLSTPSGQGRAAPDGLASAAARGMTRERGWLGSDPWPWRFPGTRAGFGSACLLARFYFLAGRWVRITRLFERSDALP